MNPLFTAAEERALSRATAARSALFIARCDLRDALWAHEDAQFAQGDTQATRRAVLGAVRIVRAGRTEMWAAELVADPAREMVG